MRQQFVAALAGVLTLTVAGCSGSSSGTHPSVRKAASQLVVASSIRDGAMLSAPTTWQATVRGVPSGDHVTAVQFMLDGKKLWRSTSAPYVFNMDGYDFMPWLLGSGAHVLTAQAATSGGATASASAHVTIAGRPVLPPASLDGLYRRSLTRADVQRTSRNQADRLQPGPFSMRIRAGLFVWEGSGTGANEVAVAKGANTIEFATTANWLVPESDAGGFCAEPESAARYTWTVSGTRLTLRPVGNDDCANRDSLLTGTWTRGS